MSKIKAVAITTEERPKLDEYDEPERLIQVTMARKHWNTILTLAAAAFTYSSIKGHGLKVFTTLKRAIEKAGTE